VFDESGVSIELTIWGDTISGFQNLVPDSIVALRQVKVGEFRGKNLSSGWGTVVDVEIPPQLPRLKALQAFCATRNNDELKPIGGAAVSSKGRGDRNKIWTMTQMQAHAVERFQRMSEDEKRTSPLFYTVVGHLAYIHPAGLYYNACPNDGCWKKVVQMGDEWRCEKCDAGFPTCTPRFISKVKIIDHTGDTWCTMAKDAVCEKVIGKTAADVKDCMEGEGADEEYFKEYLKGKQMTDWYFSIMVKQEFWNGEYREKYNIFSIEKPEESPNKCIKMLLDNILAFQKLES